MADEKLTFERITQVYREERAKKILTPLEQNFYEKLRQYIAELQKKCDEEDRTSPHSPKSIMLHDELKKVLTRRDEIWEMRVRKLVTMASSRLSGAQAEPKQLAREEALVFEGIGRILEGFTGDVCGRQAKSELGSSSAPSASGEMGVKEAKTDAATPTIPEERDAEVPWQAAFAEERKDEPFATAKPKEKNIKRDVLVVQVLEDIKPIAGKEGNYHLHKNDVATLPRDIALVLCDKKKARLIEATLT